MLYSFDRGLHDTQRSQRVTEKQQQETPKEVSVCCMKPTTTVTHQTEVNQIAKIAAGANCHDKYTFQCANTNMLMKISQRCNIFSPHQKIQFDDISSVLKKC